MTAADNFLDFIQQIWYNQPDNKGREAETITIQQKIMVAMDMAGITQAELAARMGTSPQALNQRLKRGKFTDDDFNKIAAALGCKYKSGFYFPDGQKVE